MICFWGQLSFSRQPLVPFGYELFIREGSADNWHVPTDFNRFSAQQIIDLLVKTAPNISKTTRNLSINADVEQFVNPHFYRAFARVGQLLPSVNLAIELTEHPAKNPVTDDELVTAARNYNRSGIRIIMDDVGSGDNQVARVRLLNPYVQEYKFAIQNFRGKKNFDEILEDLAFWRKEACDHRKLLTIEGIESADDIAALDAYQVDMLQGYFLNQPVYLPTRSEQVG